MLLALYAIALLLGQSPRDPNAVLEQARTKLQALTRRLANYTCVETIDRKYFRAPENRRPVALNVPRSCHAGEDRNKESIASYESGVLEWTDRLRFEVAVTGTGEILSRPGATRFDSRDVDSIVRFGPIGTGSFGSYLIGVFDNPATAFSYVGPQGARFEYRYQVSVEGSKYSVKVGTLWQPMAYHGTFLLDPETLDLERFTVTADNLPPQTWICDAETTLDFTGVRIRVADTLLPRESTMQIRMQDGRSTTNITTFSSCRAYQAESALVFDEAPEAANTAARPQFRMGAATPIGLPVTLALSALIDTDTVASGDLVSATVESSVARPGSGEVLIPAGAVVRGRITRVEHHMLPKPYFLIGLSFARLEVGGVPSLFAARLDPPQQLTEELSVELPVQSGGVTFWNNGTILIPTKAMRATLPAGYRMTWSTLATPGR